MKRKLHLLQLLLAAFFIMAQVNAQMPASITVTPEGATAADELTITLDLSKACTPDGKTDLLDAETIRLHSSAFSIDNINDWGTGWGQYGVDYNADPHDGGTTELTKNEDGTWSITMVPMDFYGIDAEETIIGISCVFNNNTWDAEGKDFGESGCKDFHIPFAFESTGSALTFNLNLTYQEELGNFSVDQSASVIVNGTTHVMEQLIEGVVPVSKFSLVIDEGIVNAETYTYKFVMADTPEDMERSVVATENNVTLSHYFNDEKLMSLSISPENATGNDAITISLTPANGCNTGDMSALDTIFMHSAAHTLDNLSDWKAGNWGAHGVDFDTIPHDGVNAKAALLDEDGDGVYTITLVPVDYYGITSDLPVIGISAVFNDGSWDNIAKDNGPEGCMDFLIPVSYESTAIAEMNGVNNIRLFPNPVNDNLQIVSEEGLQQIQIMNLVGKTFFVQHYDNNIKEAQINTSDLPQGMYIVNCIDGNNNLSTQKVIKY